VNTSSTKVKVTVSFADCGFDERRLALLTRAFGPTLVVTRSESRSQWRNRSDAIKSALAQIDDALSPSPTRVATRVGRGARERRMSDKAHRSRRKADRRWRDDD